MNQIQLFHSDEFGDVRATIFDGVPMIAAPEVAEKLGYRKASDMLRSLDDDEKGAHVVRTLGGDQRVYFITEEGFYRAALQRKPGAVKDDTIRDSIKRFQRWVTHEVLPAIRRTGGYMVARDENELVVTGTYLKKKPAKKPEACSTGEEESSVKPRDDGLPVSDPSKCVYCTLCAKKCPVGAITVDRAAKTWTLDEDKCIGCGTCHEVCPKKCIIM